MDLGVVVLSEDRNNILSSMDVFIDKIQHIRSLMLGVSLSALILAPLAIGISSYLITHPKFLHLIENEREFSLMLVVLLVVVLVTSGIWLVTGLQQFRSLSSWNKRYCDYLEKRKDLDNSISAKYNLDEE